jgi:Transposase DDE domain
MGHLLMENRSGLVVGTRLTPATGVAERTAATALTEAIPGRHRITVAADRAYDTAGFVAGLRALKATPHVAQNTAGRAARIDRRTVRHAGYLASQRARKRIEEAFAWVKTIALQAKTRFRGTERVGWAFTLAATAYNLIRLPRLLQSAP